MLSDNWYKNAIVYCVAVDRFQDSDGDGLGDFPGLTGRLDYLAGLGVTCLWLLPFQPSPRRDNGYDVSDYYSVDPRFGTLGDFVDFLREARELGIRVIIDLVINHTSNEHPWFQAARADPTGKYRNYYVWDDNPRPEMCSEVVFPGEQQCIWTYDERVGSYYLHHFYDFQPDLNIANPAVREEIRKLVGFWLELGVSGFRVDAAPFLIDMTGVWEFERKDFRRRWDFRILDELCDLVTSRRGDGVLLAEANVLPEYVPDYFGFPRPRGSRSGVGTGIGSGNRAGARITNENENRKREGGGGTPSEGTTAAGADTFEVAEGIGVTERQEELQFARRFHMLFNFHANQHLFLALAREQAEPLVRSLHSLPRIPSRCQWANFVRNHDELDLGRLNEAERQEVLTAFGPEPQMQLYERGIRRRLPPMLQGDCRRVMLAYSLLLSMPGTPVLLWGEEIGMGDDLSQPSRESVRTAMQWTAGVNAGFSEAHPNRLQRAVITDGAFGKDRVNVADQSHDPESLLNRISLAIRARRRCREFGLGRWEVVPADPPSVFAIRARRKGTAALAVHNLSAEPCEARLNLRAMPAGTGQPEELLSDRNYEQDAQRNGKTRGQLPGFVRLGPYGYRWFQFGGSHGP